MKTISCFSYKGGAGRTTLLLNVTPFLAKQLKATDEHPLVLVDMDVDSCGLTYFFDLAGDEYIDKMCTQALFGIYGIIQKDENAETALDHKLFRKMYPVGKWFGLSDKSVLCLPAQPGASFGTNNYDGDSSKMGEFVEECSEICCGVVFDSSVGNQLTATWSMQYSKDIMCCMRPTMQFREGTARFFSDFDKKMRSKRVIVIPNVVPTDPLRIDDKEYPQYAKEQIYNTFKRFDERQDNHYDLSMLEEGYFGVPKVDRFMWQESVLCTADSFTKIENQAIDCYKRIGHVICEG